MPLRRSTINQSILEAKRMFSERGYVLPPFASWSIQDWESKDETYDEIRQCMLGWDVTDFGHDRFGEIGRTLLTLRNGSTQSGALAKPYAEKLLLNPEGQRAPAHYHKSKMEDISNEGPGNVLVQLWALGSDGKPCSRPLPVQVSGHTTQRPSGDIVRLEPGMSVCIPPRTIHQFWGEEGAGVSVSREISSVCDDRTDNFFLEPSVRFPEIEEDDTPICYLCHEYPPAVRPVPSHG